MFGDFIIPCVDIDCHTDSYTGSNFEADIIAFI